MSYYSCNKLISNLGLENQFWGDYGGNWVGGSSSKSQSLVLDEEKGEIVKAEGRAGKKGEFSEEKALAALRSHSEAERRRRERISAHLDSLCRLIPCAEKMDKATLLAKVICQVKQLTITASRASKGFLIPTDADEVNVEPLKEAAKGETCNFKASLCCEFGSELLPGLKNSLDALNLSVERAEISTLGKRVKYVFYFMPVGQVKDEKSLVVSVREALTSVVDKIAFSTEYTPRTAFPNKRRRFSLFEKSGSSF